MSTPIFDQLEKRHWFLYTPPPGGEPWRIFRTDNDLIVFESPALVESPRDEQLQMALWMGLSQSWQTPARLLMRDGLLRLQASIPSSDLQEWTTLWKNLQSDVASAQAALANALRDEGSQEDVAPVREVSVQQQTLMENVLTLMESDSSLKPLLDLDVPSANLWMEAPDGQSDWLIMMQPSRQDGHVWAFVPQASLPDEEDARVKVLEFWLQVNDALQLGPNIQIVSDETGLQPMLQTQFDANYINLADLRVILGRLLAVDEELNALTDLSESTKASTQEPDISYLLSNGLRG
jgi:hypothetical protein